MQKGFTPILVLVGMLVIVAVAGGVYYFGKSQIPRTQPQNPVVSQATQPSPSSSSLLPVVTKNNETLTPELQKQILPLDETANWKIYKGKDYMFKYPFNGEIMTDQPSDVYISANTQPYFTFTIKTEDNPNHLTTKQAIDKLVTDLKNNQNAPWAKSQADQTLQTMKEYTKGQVIGVKLQSFDEGYPQKFGEVVEATEDKIYKFSIGDGSGGGVSDDDEKLLDQILSTFKFTR